MRKFNEQNERIKRQYLTFLKEAKGQDEASLDKVAAALLDFEEALEFKPFKAFHRDWAGALQAPSGEAAERPHRQAPRPDDPRRHAAAGQGLLPLARLAAGLQVADQLRRRGLLQQQREGRSRGARPAPDPLPVDRAMRPRLPRHARGR